MGPTKQEMVTPENIPKSQLVSVSHGGAIPVTTVTVLDCYRVTASVLLHLIIIIIIIIIISSFIL